MIPNNVERSITGDLFYTDVSLGVMHTPFWPRRDALPYRNWLLNENNALINYGGSDCMKINSIVLS